MSEQHDAVVTITVDGFEAEEMMVQLNDARVTDLERAILTAVIELRAVRLLIWSFHVSATGVEFSSPECRALWRWLINFSPGCHLVPSKEEVRRRFPGFRFVQARFPLLQMAAKLFKTPRFFGRRPARSADDESHNARNADER